ncbi:hypothetical protein SARC_02967 [Sphaeroforma arctica JP610]|uniref:Uncharacterized protein n=1 Tax=Sphaeroforma arctica JP610 TaxID=667725 RepID=A0A0L0G7G8_9EUKA|nr:hypothetical protein SARC_02967 [Sphaeroforma arctica JP610]KNC84826.1 hypothetical protein SARC_02967 [Sphaeroforma arctica JP610]|eukprot:XP_014158728.1 hypothetical protein SARC_02967 [Sphaeroforma arctica JP610]
MACKSPMGLAFVLRVKYNIIPDAALRHEIAITLHLCPESLWAVPMAILSLYVEESVTLEYTVYELKRFNLFVAYVTLTEVPLAQLTLLVALAAAVLMDVDVESIRYDDYWNTLAGGLYVSDDFFGFVKRGIFDAAIIPNTSRPRSANEGRRDTALFYFGYLAGLFPLQHADQIVRDSKRPTLPVDAKHILRTRQTYLVLPSSYKFKSIATPQVLGTVKSSTHQFTLKCDLKNLYMYHHDPMGHVDSSNMLMYQRRKRMVTLTSLLPILALL